MYPPSLLILDKNIRNKDCRIVRKLYGMILLNEHENSWVSKLKTILFYCNLQETWQTQTFGNKHQFKEKVDLFQR